MADTKLSDLTAVTDVLVADEFLLARSGASKKITAANLAAGITTGAGLFDAYAYLRDEKAAGTVGGAATTGSFQTRVLNTEVVDTAGIVSLSANQFTLAAGTFWIKASAPFYSCGRAQLKIRNITDSSDAAVGGAQYSPTGGDPTTIRAWVAGRITIAGSKAFELQYRCASNSSGDTKVLGVEANFGVVEVYAEVEIWRET